MPKIKVSHSFISSVTLVIFILIVVSLGGSIVYMKESISAEQNAVTRKEEFKQLGIDLADASDFLTDEARKFAVTNDLIYMNKYWQEINVTKTRDNVIYKIIEMNAPANELSLLAEAKKNSDGLVETEKRSMKLVLEALKVSTDKIPSEVLSFNLNTSDQSLSKSEKLQKAIDIMYNAKYDSDKETIMMPIEKFQASINNISEIELEAARKVRITAETFQIILSCLIIFAIGLLLIIIFTQLTIPIKSYGKELLGLNFDGSFFRLVPKGSKELRTLADNFNKMFDSLQIELVKRKKAELEMKIARDEAQIANKAKGEFLANMSHEIRTPLNAIIGYEFMLCDTSLTEKQKSYANRIQISAKNLLGIINNILDFSKIEVKKLVVEAVPFNIYSICDELSSMMYFEIQRKGLSLKISIDKNIPNSLSGDPVRVKQVILNLFSNAIKFTDKGSISISVNLLRKVSDEVTLEFIVADTGIGISKEQTKFLFEPFKQGDASTTRKYGGTGLGLSISKELVEIMGGRIFVESEFGAGTVFTFVLSFKEVSEYTESEKRVQNIGNSNAIFKNKKILLVEDNIINSEMTKEILEISGFKVQTADSGFIAIEKIKNNKFDVVLMDIHIPDMDGYEITSKIRKIRGMENLPIIALTADIIDGVIGKAKSAGLNDYLTKPLNIESLINTLKKYVYAEGSNLKNTPSQVKAAFDKEILNYHGGLDRIGGNKSKYRNILNLFIQNHIYDAEKLNSYLEHNDWEKFKTLVHTIKGIAGNIGASKLMGQAIAIETVIPTKDKARLTTLVHDFENLLKETTIRCNEIIDAFLIEESKDDAEMKEVNMKDDKNTNIVKGCSDNITELVNLLQAGNIEAKFYFDNNRDYLINSFGENNYNKLKEKISSYAFEEAYNDITEMLR